MAPDNLPVTPSFLAGKERVNRVYYLMPVPDTDSEFEELYLSVRHQEGRILSDGLVRILPSIPAGHPLHHEWRCRTSVARQVIHYLDQQPRPLSILEVGCGNGWFSGQLMGIPRISVVGLDINRLELEQAARVFKHPALRFACATLEDLVATGAQFDAVLFNASAHYFRDLKQLLDTAMQVCSPGGEVHLVDTPLYHASEVETARASSAKYYGQLGHAKMAEWYFHHAWDALDGFSHRVMHRPASVRNKVKKRLGGAVSPFPWVVIPRV